MRKAWVENNRVRDVCLGNPDECYHPSVAVYFDTDIPDGVRAGATWDGSAWINPPTPPAPDPENPTVVEYTAALEAMYDAKAQERRYDNRLTCALRAGYPGPFQAEGLAFALWMDAQNAKAYVIMGEVLSETRPAPTIAELLAEMDALVWPA